MRSPSSTPGPPTASSRCCGWWSRCRCSAAVVLLVGGPLARGALDKVGHLIGTAMSAASFVVSLILFVALLGRAEDDRQVSQHLFTWFQAGQLDVGFDLLYDPLSALFLLLITGVGSLIHVYSIGYMAHDARRPPVLRLPQPVRRRDADAGALGQLPRPVPGLGGRRPRVVPPHRLLAAQALGGRRGEEGVRHQPRRRHRPLAGDRPHVRHVRHHRLQHHQRGVR